MAKLFSYEEKGTWMEDLCGVTKLIFFLAWTITCMLTYACHYACDQFNLV